jgi:hypothetical protein
MNLLLWNNRGLRSTGTLAKEQCQNTFSNGCLGSHTDEERSEMRYVMRIAKSVSHQNFERILHFLRGVCLLECLFIPTNPHSLKQGAVLIAAHRFPRKCVQMKTQSYNRSYSV